MVNLLNQLMQLSVEFENNILATALTTTVSSPPDNHFYHSLCLNKTYLRSVCTGQDHVSISSPGPRSCSVTLDRVQTSDKGRYMCLLNQADVFHTDRR